RTAWSFTPFRTQGGDDPEDQRPACRGDARSQHSTCCQGTVDFHACAGCHQRRHPTAADQTAMTFQCERCGRAGRYSTWVTARWRNGNTMQRCDYCGEPHSCAYGRAASAIHPPLLSVDQPGILTPWVDRSYKPYKPGTYECEFSDCHALRLQWDG